MKVVALLSRGIDRPVSVALALKKGIEVHAVHFSPETLNKTAKEEKMNKLVTILKEKGDLTFYTVAFKEIQKKIITYVPAKYRMIIYRRLMFRIAEKILKKIKAKAFLTGDSLGQVASQTTENIRTIYSATKYSVFTPLLGKNKQEIINKAKEEGTYETSILPYEDCCSFMIAKHPELRSSLKEIEKMENNVEDYWKMIEDSEITQSQ